MQYKKHFFTKIIILFIISTGIINSQNQSVKISEEEKKQFIENVSTQLIENYVFEDVAIKISEYLKKNLEDGKYDKTSDAQELAKLFTKDMQKISKDKHMRARVNRREEVNNDMLGQYKRSLRSFGNNNGFNEIKILDGNVGYLDLRGFSSSPRGMGKGKAAMKMLNHVDAIIFDLRNNGGGSPRMVQLLSSYLFDEKTHLNSLYWRRGDETQEFWTLDNIDGKTMGDVPVYILTSNYTFSAAEEFTYNLKTRNRAKIVGELTGGGANPGGTFRITRNFGVFVPTGRAINPITKINWEGVGIAPHIATTKEEAFDKAYKLAKQDAEERRKVKIEKAARTITKLESLLKTDDLNLSENYNSNKKSKIYNLLKILNDSNVLSENDLNQLGYQYMGEKNMEAAIAVFTFNTEAYPKSANTYDSLGEAFMTKGENELAIKNYKKSLDLDPENVNAKAMIEKMKS